MRWTVAMHTRAVLSRMFDVRCWTLYSAVNLRCVSGTSNFSNSSLGLLAEIGAVHEEENPRGVRMPDQTVRDIGGGEGLAGSRGHLDQCPRAIGTERLFEVTDGGGLDLPQPRVIEHRHNAHPRAEGRRLRICGYLKDPVSERFGPVEGEDPAATCIGIVTIGEAGLAAGGFVDERERVHRWRHPARKASNVGSALMLHLNQGGAFRLRLDHPDRLTGDEKEVIDPAVPLLQDELPDRNTTSRVHIRVVDALDDPASGLELPVDVDSRLGLAGEVSFASLRHKTQDMRSGRGVTSLADIPDKR